MRIVSVGHAVFAAAMVATGILGLIDSKYATLWGTVPDGVPVRAVLLYLCPIASLACGMGLLWPHTAPLAARVLLAWVLIWTLLFKVSFIFLHPAVEGFYQSAGENAVIVAGVWVLYAWLATDRDRHWLAFATGNRGVRLARVIYGLALIAFGLSHFFYLDLTAPLIPGWLPWHTGLAYFTGSAYLAAGVAILVGVWARLAATLSTLQMGLFLFLVWLPIILAGRMSERNWKELIVTGMLTAGAWVVTDSYRGLPWFALGKAMRGSKRRAGAS